MPRKTASKAAPAKKTKPKTAAKPRKAAPAEPKPPTSTEKIEAVGLDAICARFEAGDSIRKVAQSIGVPSATLLAWCNSPEHSARTREARELGADAMSDEAETVLEGAKDPVAIQRARELASHYRWKAKMLDPGRYGDKVQVDATVREDKLTDAQLDARLSTLAAKFGFALPGNG